MTSHVIEMTAAEQQQALEMAHALAREFAAVGAQHDRENSFPYALVEKFRASGLVALTVPKRFGGLGGDIATFARCVEILATGDPACALGFNMHLAVIGFFRGMWSEAHQARFFTGVAQSGHLFDGAYSETRAGVIGLADTLAIPVAGGFRVNGKKTWATLSLAADFHTLNASIADENGDLPSTNDARAAREVMLVCPATAPGVRIEHTWDAMGMRATGTETVVFDDVFIPESDLVSSTFRPGLFANLEWQTLSFAAVYLGLARRAYAETVAITAKKSLGAVLGANDVHLREQQRVQMGIGEMRLLLEAAANSIEVIAARLNRGDGLPTELESRLAMVEMPKVLATENALRIVDIGMRLVGGGSYRRGHILERLYRDARSGPFHPLTTDQALELLGRTELQNAART